MLVPCPQLPLVGPSPVANFWSGSHGIPIPFEIWLNFMKMKPPTTDQSKKMVDVEIFLDIPWNRILKKQHERIIIRYYDAGLWRNIDDFSMTILAYFHGVGAYSWMSIVVFWGGSLTWKENEHVSSLQMSPVSPWIYHPNWGFLGKRRALTLVRDQITCDHEWSMSWPTLQNLVLGPLPCTRA